MFNDHFLFYLKALAVYGTVTVSRAAQFGLRRQIHALLFEIRPKSFLLDNAYRPLGRWLVPATDQVCWQPPSCNALSASNFFECMHTCHWPRFFSLSWMFFFSFCIFLTRSYDPNKPLCVLSLLSAYIFFFSVSSNHKQLQLLPSKRQFSLSAAVKCLFKGDLLFFCS